MVFVGLDFGTTTSILSYLEGTEPKPFHYGGYADYGTPYIPSVVAYQPKTLLIGQYATEMRPTQASLYRYFKMLLPLEARENWNADFGPYADEAREPAQVTADFIGELICGSSPERRRLSLKNNPDAFLPSQMMEIEGLVVSVPQVWSDVRAHGRQQLQSVITDLVGLPLIHLISEPVAAAAYFAHLFMKKQKEPYRGNLLICDMGGGTFDVTLCRLSKDRVEVLCNAGNGEGGLGIAGAHFDRDLLKLSLKTTVAPDVWSELLVVLDQTKKGSRESANRLESYLQLDPLLRTAPIYNLGLIGQGVSIRFEEVVEAFEQVREGIFQVLGTIKREAERQHHSIDRVVMVGGFSKFPLVQKAVGEFFGEDVFDNPKLIDLHTLNRDDMAFAISKGACLVANKMVQVTERYEHTISIFVHPREGTATEELELIKSGTSLDILEKTRFCLREDGQRRKFKITSGTVNVDISIRLSGGQDEHVKLVRKLSLTDVPNSYIENSWFLGTRVDKSKIPYLVIKDVRYGEEKEYPLGDLIPPIITED